MSQPKSCTFSFIIPITCAPSTALKIPFERASAQISLAGSTTPVAVVMWLKKITLVRGVIASLNRFSAAAAFGTGFGKRHFLHHNAVPLRPQIKWLARRPDAPDPSSTLRRPRLKSSPLQM